MCVNVRTFTAELFEQYPNPVEPHEEYLFPVHVYAFGLGCCRTRFGHVVGGDDLTIGKSGRRGIEQAGNSESAVPLPLRLVIDTNILVSAALKPGGLQRTVLVLALTKPARLYVTRLRAREALTTPVSLAKIDSAAMETVQFAPRRGTG